MNEAGADTLNSMVSPFMTRDKVKTPVLLLCRFLQNLIIRRVDAGWSSLAARRAHNPKVVGSNPTPATKIDGRCAYGPAVAGFAVFEVKWTVRMIGGARVG